MKKIILSLSVFGFFIAFTASAQTGMMNDNQYMNYATTTGQTSSSSVSASLADIYQNQNINSQDKIDCSKVTSAQYEKLGDAVMGSGISEQQHTAMENMMGGEGSLSLNQVHMNMGESYLRCNGTSSSYGGDMMGGNFGMMGGFDTEHFLIGGISLILFWILMVLGIIALFQWVKKNK